MREGGRERRETEGKKLGREGGKREEGGRVGDYEEKGGRRGAALNFTYPQNRCRK